jgi:hypothetical protein
VSRLAANIPMISHNLAPLSFTDVPRESYLHAMLGLYALRRTEMRRQLRPLPNQAIGIRCLERDLEPMKLGPIDRPCERAAHGYDAHFIGMTHVSLTP